MKIKLEKLKLDKLNLEKLKLDKLKLDWGKHKWYIIIISALVLIGVTSLIIYLTHSDDSGKDEGFEKVPTRYFNISNSMQVVVKVNGRRNEIANFTLRNGNGIFLNEVLTQNSFFFSGTYISGLQKLKINNLILIVPDGYNKGNILLNCEYSNENGIGHYFYNGKVAEW